MPKTMLFLPTGFEETEAITTVDILRRGDVCVHTVSITDEIMVLGSHDILIKADKLFKEVEEDYSYDMIILPGGPGTKNYFEHPDFLNLVKKYNDNGKQIGAICAAPTVIAKLGILNSKKAVCYPTCENEISQAIITCNNVETDTNITTSKGPGTTVHFAFRLLEILIGTENAEKVKEKFIAQI